MKLIKVWLVGVLILFSNVNAKSIQDLLSMLQNKTASMKYFYFIANNSPFLTRQNANGGYSVWLYTQDRKWKPIHNASGFDGFLGADKIFTNVSIVNDNKKVSFSAISGSNAIQEASYLASKTFDIGWYFWTQDSIPFLVKPNKDGDVSIWHYTQDKKWQPVYNASAFDNFPGRPNTFDNIAFSASTLSLDVGIINPKYDISLNKVLPGLPSNDNTNNDNVNTNTFDAKTYYNADCKSCHGVIGEGGSSEAIGGDSLREYIRDLNGYKTGRKRHGTMNFLLGKLDDTSINSLAKYLTTFPKSSYRDGDDDNDKNDNDDNYKNGDDDDDYGKNYNDDDD